MVWAVARSQSGAPNAGQVLVLRAREDWVRRGAPEGSIDRFDTCWSDDNARAECFATGGSL